MPGYNSGGSMCTTPERFYQIQKEAAARHAAAREEEAGEQFAKVMAVLQEMGKDTDFISVMRESFINESKRRHSGGGGSGGGGGVGYDDGEHKCHTLNDPGEVWELASDAVAPTAVVEHVLGKRARHVRSEYEEEGEEDEESEGEENEGEEGEGEKGEGEEGEGEEGPVAGGAAPADQSVAGDVQILISEIGLDPKVLAQYGSLLGQLTHRQQKRRVIAQGGQFGYGGKGSAAGWQLRRLVNSFLEQLGIGSSEQRMFSVAYTEGVGAQSEHQDEEERHCRTSICVTEDGKPRLMGFRRRGGVLTIHYVRWDGTLDIIRVPAGVQRIVQIPAFGFFSMTGWGSGAGDSDVWHEVVALRDASSAGLLVDRYATVAAQPQMLARALSLLQLRGQQHTGSRPVLCLPVPTLINLGTEELDKSEGVVISLNYYWKLCRLRVITHEEGRSEREMKRLADQNAGFGGEWREEYDFLLSMANDSKEIGDLELAASLRKEAEEDHYSTVTLNGKRDGGRKTNEECKPGANKGLGDYHKDWLHKCNGKCQRMLLKTAFSGKQWKKATSERKCGDCTGFGL